MSSVGLVLGGGGVTGAAHELAALMALELATGWNADEAEVVVGTSAGAYVAALLRNGRLDLDCLVAPGDTRQDVAARISGHLFGRTRGADLSAWVRHGLVAGLRRPGLTFLLGSPAPWSARGLAQWVREQIGEAAGSWPERPTLITAYDIRAQQRVVFGSENAPDVGIADAVAASGAIPLLFRPWKIGDTLYVDGGVVSGTHADLVLGWEHPLDLVLVFAPLAVADARRGAWWHERVLDRVGVAALDAEVAAIRRRWPGTEVLVLTPSAHTLSSMRPNPMDPKGAVPSFIKTLVSMRRTLARPEVWGVIERHLVGDQSRRALQGA